MRTIIAKEPDSRIIDIFQSNFKEISPSLFSEDRFNKDLYDLDPETIYFLHKINKNTLKILIK